MKKVLVLILALMMMLSLTACGGEKIEITTDNWQDYLEYKQIYIAEKEVDDFGDVVGERPIAHPMLCLKDEYKDMDVSDDSDITVAYKANNVFYNCKIENGSVVVGDKAEFTPQLIDETIDNCHYVPSYQEVEDMLVNDYAKVVLFTTLVANNETIGILEDFEITRIEGTLVLE